MPDYVFYTRFYGGTDLSAEEFERLKSRAGAYVSGLTGGELSADPARRAVCAVAEAMNTIEQGGELASQSVGSWSKAYAAKTPRTDEQKLRDAAMLYLSGSGCVRRWL